MLWVKWRNFQLSIDSNPGVLCSGVPSHKTRTKHDLIARVFPRSTQFV